ncbi:sulfotransferase [Pontibacter sp. G13]|uniref:sulfotransferase family protein n=1 Tax=Pontibacter sp. G13 TaxID=3074898 RepID=UPI0028895CDA|nr:sulfotransferase [Pontibacter sp. G13]WNJ17605.1 sulfotransferase [Pontibacter sp. G13]
MKEDNTKLLLILGCQRSGTTLLSAMLGGHPEISMLFESTDEDVMALIGKKYRGNKLLTWRQIRMNQRASRFGYLMNRLANIDLNKKAKPHKTRPFPTSRLSIQDYIDLGAKIITITRKKDEVVSSIINRTKMSEAQASSEYDLAMAEVDKVRHIAHNINFSELVGEPTETLKGICEFLELDFEERMLEGPKYNFVYPHKAILKEKSSETSPKWQKDTSRQTA